MESCNIFQYLPRLLLKMTSDERQSRIAAQLQKAEFASLEELARRLGTSVSTVRRVGLQ